MHAASGLPNSPDVPDVPNEPAPAAIAAATAGRRLTPSQAIIARPLLVMLPVLALLLPSVTLAFVRQPTYTAEARLLVGGFNVEAQAVPGFVEASRTLAETYSRLVSTRAISERVAAIMKVDVGQVDGHIDATSVPSSSIIRVMGRARSARIAIRFTAAAAQALSDYVDQTGGLDDAKTLLDGYRQASLELNQAIARRDALQRLYNARSASGPVADADVEALSAAEADADRAKLEADTLAANYSKSRGSKRTSGNIDLVAPAGGARTDRKKNLELAIAGPLLLGLVAGVALATLAANRRGNLAAARPRQP